LVSDKIKKGPCAKNENQKRKRKKMKEENRSRLRGSKGKLRTKKQKREKKTEEASRGGWHTPQQNRSKIQGRRANEPFEREKGFSKSILFGKRKRGVERVGEKGGNIMNRSRPSRIFGDVGKAKLKKTTRKDG